MKKINFQKLAVRRALADNSTTEIDISKALADLSYTKMSGMTAHTLAHKLFETNGEVELSEEETNIILRAVETFAVPFIIDAVRESVN